MTTGVEGILWTIYLASAEIPPCITNILSNVAFKTGFITFACLWVLFAV